MTGPTKPDETRRPHRPPSHRPLELAKLMNLGLALEDAADGDALSCDAIEELGVDEGGVPRSHMYAAMALSPELAFEREEDTAVVVCAGACQQWGSLDLLERLLRAREDRLDEGESAFDVRAVLCHDQCEHAPVATIATDSGTALVRDATADTVIAALAELDD